jgi:hypothetical protein
MTLRQQQPEVPGVLDQTSAGFDQSLLQTRQRPVADSFGQHQPTPRKNRCPIGKVRNKNSTLSKRHRSSLFRRVTHRHGSRGTQGINLLFRFSLKSLRGQDSWRRRNICEWSLFKFDANQPVSDRINILYRVWRFRPLHHNHRKWLIGRWSGRLYIWAALNVIYEFT